MKRGLFAVAFLIPLFGLAVPWLAGGRAEVHHRRLLQDLQGRGLQVAESSYRRGWLGSEVETVLLPGGAGWRLIASSRIEHGPLAWSDLLGGRLQPLVARVTTRFALAPDGGEPQPLPTLLESRMDLQGATRMLLRSERELFAEDAGHTLLAQGLEGELHLAKGAQELRVDLRLPLLALLEGDRPLLRLRDLAASAITERGVAGLHLGRGSLTLAEASVDSAGLAAPLRILGLEAQTRSGAEGEMIWATAAYRAQRFEAGGERFSAPELKLRTDRLSAPLLARIDRDLRELAVAGSAGGVDALSRMAALAANTAGLLENEPELAVERLYLDTPDGAVMGRLTLTLAGLRPLDLLNPRRWLEVLEGSGELSMPEALLRRLVAAQIRYQLEGGPAIDASAAQGQWVEEEARRRIDRLVRQEFALRQEGQLHTRMRVSAGLLTINGKSIPLPLLVQLSG